MSRRALNLITPLIAKYEDYSFILFFHIILYPELKGSVINFQHMLHVDAVPLIPLFHQGLALSFVSLRSL